MLLKIRTTYIIAIAFTLVALIVLAVFKADSSQSYYSAAAISISAIMALTAAVINIKYQRTTARDKNSLDLQEQLRSDEKYSKSLRVVFKVIQNRSDVNPLQVYTNRHNYQDQYSAINYVLNTWERIGLAVRHDLYDELYLYNTYKTMVIQLSIMLREVINHAQKDNPAYFENFTWLSLHWTIRRDSFESNATKAELARILKELNKVKAGKFKKV